MNSHLVTPRPQRRHSNFCAQETLCALTSASVVFPLHKLKHPKNNSYTFPSRAWLLSNQISLSQFIISISVFLGVAKPRFGVHSASFQFLS